MRITGKAQTSDGRLRALRVYVLGLSVALLVAVASVAGASVVPGPHPATGGVEHVHGTSAQLSGSVNPNGLETSYYFQYGPTVAYGMQTKPVAIGHGTTTVKVGVAVTGLLAGYHYRIVATAPNPANPSAPFVVTGKDDVFSGGKTSKLRFVVAKRKEGELGTYYGGSVELVAALQGLGFAGKTVLLQATPYPYSAPFVQIGAPVVSSSNGTITVRFLHVKQNTELRLVTTDLRPLYSPTMLVHVSPALSMRVQKLSGGRFRFYGTVQPATVHGSVTIQQLRPQKAGSKKEGPRPHTVATAPIKHGGKTFERFSVIVSGLTGNYRYRAYVRLTKGPLDSGPSGNVLVKAPKTAAKEHAKRKKRKKTE